MSQILIIQHTLSCKVGCLIICCHGEIKDELGQLAGKALIPSAICDEPLINFNGHKVDCSSNAPIEADFSTPLPSPVVRDNDNRGDLMIRGFWSHGTNCTGIIDVWITDLDSKSYLKESSGKVLARQEQEKKHGLIGKESQTFTKRLAGALLDTWQRPY
eukprot:scaffold55553_cov56-Attheya_sp.AAC.1